MQTSRKSLQRLFLVAILATLTASAGMVTFEERIDNSRLTVTPVVNSEQAGLAGQQFRVWKFIYNASHYNWSDFHITICTIAGAGTPGCMSPDFGPSPESDGISFDQPTPFGAWAAGVEVDIDGVLQAPGTWSVKRTNVPFDEIHFDFLGFRIKPGQTLSLHFDMRDNDNNTWFLKQRATIPEPSTVVLIAAGLAMVAFRRMR